MDLGKPSRISGSPSELDPRESYDRRETALRLSRNPKKSFEFYSKSGHVEKLVCDDTAAERLQNLVQIEVWRQPYKTE